jgi:xylulokinase
MSLLGIDIGTTGCKSIAFSLRGDLIASSYREYDFVSPQPGYAELSGTEVWNKIKDTIKEVGAATKKDPITAISSSSMGEALVPVTRDRRIVGNSLLQNDLRGDEFLQELLTKTTPEKVYRINGNFPDVFFSMPKIAWLRKYKPEVYDGTDYFLPWADFATFMLGGEPCTNHSLANRTLLFDIHKQQWSTELFKLAGLDTSKFAPPVASGTHTGNVLPAIARELGLGLDTALVSGGHDQCCAALGSGVTGEGRVAMYGMGTYICIVPVFSSIPSFDLMFSNRLHTENHIVPGKYISFIYNISGGALVKWYKNTFANLNREHPQMYSVNYDSLFAEIPEAHTNIVVVPRFGPTGPPDFFRTSAGTISGLSFEHTRADILLATLEGITFYFREFFRFPENNFFNIEKFVASGGGSRSDKWLQVTSNILNKPVARNKTIEAGSLGAAILAGAGSRVFNSMVETAAAMVKLDKEILPVKKEVEFYDAKYEAYLQLYTHLKEQK